MPDFTVLGVLNTLCDTFSVVFVSGHDAAQKRDLYLNIRPWGLPHTVPSLRTIYAIHRLYYMFSRNDNHLGVLRSFSSPLLYRTNVIHMSKHLYSSLLCSATFIAKGSKTPSCLFCMASCVEGKTERSWRKKKNFNNRKWSFVTICVFSQINNSYLFLNGALF